MNIKCYECQQLIGADERVITTTVSRDNQIPVPFHFHAHCVKTILQQRVNDRLDMDAYAERMMRAVTPIHGRRNEQ